MYAIAAGVLIGVTTIWGMKWGKTEHKPWAYPMVLSLYPLFYFAFAIFAKDSAALLQEMIYALPIFLICILCCFKHVNYSAVILALGYIGHGLYDVFHDHLFINTGTPIWWPEFCGTVDILIGVYLLVFAMSLPRLCIVQVEH